MNWTDSDGNECVYEFISLRNQLINYLELFEELNGEVTKQEAEDVIRVFAERMSNYIMEDRENNEDEGY